MSVRRPGGGGQEGKRLRTGRLIQRDRVTVEAAGEFVLLGREGLARMAERARSGGRPHPS
ncbi:MAG: hypothetical protein QOE54_1875 [Streptosporangiaceae bacterium]|jgi:hypothetical protein|nr:hypothetical protein [Streptosporangiaceae bacterium]